MKDKKELYRIVCPKCKDEKLKEGQKNYSKENMIIYEDGLSYCFRCHYYFKNKIKI